MTSPIHMQQVAKPVYVAEKSTGVIHVERYFHCPHGENRKSVTRCGKELDFDAGETDGRIFHLGFRHVLQEGCEECA